MDLSNAIVEHKPVESTHDIDIHCASHLTSGLHPDDRRITVRRICLLLKAIERQGTCQGGQPIKFDAIAARGLSGLLVAPIVAMTLNKTLLVVRKGEKCHSELMVEGDYGARNYIIIDDFISMGGTVAATIDEIAKAVPLAQCVGMVHYRDITDDRRTPWKARTHGDRCRRHFYTTSDLTNHSTTIVNQARRAVDALAQLQSFGGLGVLAQTEKQKRALKISDVYYGARVQPQSQRWTPSLGWQNIGGDGLGVLVQKAGA